MADSAVVCALVLARFLQFMDFHGNVAVYAQDYDSSMYVLETAGNLADQLALCEGRAWEIAMLAKIGLGPVRGPRRQRATTCQTEARGDATTQTRADKSGGIGRRLWHLPVTPRD